MKWRLRRVRKPSAAATKHFLEHKEKTRALVHQKLEQWNQHKTFTYRRVAIRNTKRTWGSCTSLKNLNFNYRIIFLPSHLQDYIIVHELCHLHELNHSLRFWSLLATYIPNYKACMAELRMIEKSGELNQPLALVSLQENLSDTTVISEMTVV
jgi:predicted metal-dependent hydrolase